MSCAKAKPLAKLVPTSRLPNSPGPRVKAMALSWLASTPARFRAASTTGTIFSWCARLASSGTTPPNSSCTPCDAVTLLSRMPSRNTAADVSSQLDSIARITTFSILFTIPLYIFACKGTIFFTYVQIKRLIKRTRKGEYRLISRCNNITKNYPKRSNSTVKWRINGASLVIAKPRVIVSRRS